MTTTILPLSDVTQSAIHMLCQEFGVVNTVRFLNQFHLGYGSYTDERATMFAHLTVDEIVQDIYQQRTEEPK